MDGLSVSDLAELAGTTAAEVERLVQLGILAARDSTGPFLESDVPKGPPGYRVRAGWAADGGDRVGDPGGPAVVFLPGGGAVSSLGGAVGADLPAGEPGHRDPLGDARSAAGVDGVRPGGS